MKRKSLAIDIEEIDAIKLRAEHLRAEAIRASWRDMARSFRKLVQRIGHMLEVPRTEQL